MLKSCPYCGRIHDDKYICEQKTVAIKRRQSKRDGRNKFVCKFRGLKKWTDKSIEIRERDKFCCQICIRGLYGTGRRIETESISVHHIIPIAEDYNRRLDNDILITLCSRHHEMAEAGIIPRDELLKIAEEQESKSNKE